MEAKKCTKCKEIKTTNDFWPFTRNGKKRLHIYCKTCTKLAKRKPKPLIDEIEGEIWRDVKDYEGLYQVSNFARVKSLEKEVKGYGTKVRRIIQPLIKKQGINTTGYYSVMLSKEHKLKTVRVHRLVAEAFVPNPHNKPFINHIDSNKLNNLPENLEYVTHKENMAHAQVAGVFKGRKYRSGSKGTAKSKPVYKCDLQGNILEEYPCMLHAAKANNITHTRISMCCNGQGNIAAGYKWKLKDVA